jgi:hypothetical protein
MSDDHFGEEIARATLIWQLTLIEEFLPLPAKEPDRELRLALTRRALKGYLQTRRSESGCQQS